jgi:hypothetical protein
MRKQDEIWLVAHMAIDHYGVPLRVPQIELFARKIGTKIKHGTFYGAMEGGEKRGYFVSVKVGKERYYRHGAHAQELD